MSVECEWRVDEASIHGTVAIFWKSDDQEVWYHDVPPGGVVQQSTYPGHVWVFREKTSGRELATITASEEARQVTTISRVRDLTWESAREEPTAPAAAPTVARTACWRSADLQFSFERAHRDGLWREIDHAGSDAGELELVACSLSTRWFWWAGELWGRYASLPPNVRAVIGASLFILSSRPHLLPPELLQRFTWPSIVWKIAIAFQITPNTVAACAIVVLGWTVAAAVPIMEQSVVLKSSADGRLLRLTESSLSLRDPRVGSNAWRQVARGTWTAVPEEVLLPWQCRGHHAATLAAVAALLARVVAKVEVHTLLRSVLP